jgi:hypothetical protein
MGAILWLYLGTIILTSCFMCKRLFKLVLIEEANPENYYSTVLVIFASLGPKYLREQLGGKILFWLMV